MQMQEIPLFNPTPLSPDLQLSDLVARSKVMETDFTSYPRKTKLCLNLSFQNRITNFCLRLK